MRLCSERATHAFSLITALILFAATAAATPITPAAFSSERVVESFEGLTPGPNISRWGFLSPTDIWLEPGSVSAFQFSSGVILTQPIPNPHAFGGNVLIGDYAVGTGGWGWGLTGNGTAGQADIPTGSAYLGFNGGASVIAQFTFPWNVIRVGTWITTDTGISNNATLRAYDRSGNLLEAVTIPGVPHGSWRSNFIGLENLSGIARIVIVGNGGVMDDLTFDLAAPESSGLALAGGGLALILLRRFHRSAAARAR
jgi:hypothetical protein